MIQLQHVMKAIAGRHAHVPPYVCIYGLALLLFAITAALAPGWADAQPTLPPSTIQPAARHAAQAGQAFLPFVSIRTDHPEYAIWNHADAAAPHEVTLFRHRFTLDAPLDAPSLHIFADTRYEVWLDGEWLGRGPARFARNLREYDYYELEDLAAGDHVLAVLVQWAPNKRRSESLRPLLRASLYTDSRNEQTVLASGPEWKALQSRAWRSDAADIHNWGLIGPGELLDLRRLANNWMHPAFDDSAWPNAAIVDTSGTEYALRSIPQLVETPVRPVVIDIGQVSPDRMIVEIPPAVDRPTEFAFELDRPTQIRLEALAGTAPGQSASLQLNGQPLTWQASPGRPADVQVATPTLPRGRHSLAPTQPAPQGWTLAISRRGLTAREQNLAASPNVGRRSLLAELDSKPELLNQIPEIDPTGLHLTFDSAQEFPAYAILDLGRIVHGRLKATVNGPAGSIIDLGWDERLWQDRRPLPYPGSLHPQWNQTDSWILDGTERTLSTIDARTGRYLLLIVWGPGPVTLTDLQVSDEHYPIRQRGYFSGPSEHINQIWQVGYDGMRLNMIDAYADPWRERGQWWGDAHVVHHINQVSSGDLHLLRRGLLLMSDALRDGRPNALAPNGQDIMLLDYGLLWVQSLADYTRLSGDRQLIRTVFPTLKTFMRTVNDYVRADTDLLELQPPAPPLNIGVYIDSSASSDRYGQSTALNAIYYGSLQDAAYLAEQAEEPLYRRQWQQQADRIYTAFNQRLYQADQGRYTQRIVAGRLELPSVYAQAWALAYDLVPPARQQAVADAALELLAEDPTAPNVQLYGMFWLLEGLARAGRHHEALDIIERYYGSLLDRGATSWWEHFNADTRYDSSLSHGWGGAPTWFLSSHILGARQLSPQNWEVQPALHVMPQLDGAIPLADGDLLVSWETLKCSERRLTIDAPDQSRGTLILPLLAPDLRLELDKKLIWVDGQAYDERISRQGQQLRIELDGGQYQLQIQQECRPRQYLPQVISPVTPINKTTHKRP